MIIWTFRNNLSGLVLGRPHLSWEGSERDRIRSINETRTTNRYLTVPSYGRLCRFWCGNLYLTATAVLGKPYWARLRFMSRPQLGLLKHMLEGGHVHSADKSVDENVHQTQAVFPYNVPLDSALPVIWMARLPWLHLRNGRMAF